MTDQTTNQNSVWRQSERPFWWPDAQGLAIASIIFIDAAALFIRMFRTSNVDDKMLDTMITILFSTCLVAVFQYLFGSSRGSAQKDDTQNKIVERALITPPVVAPVVVAPIAPSAFNPPVTVKGGTIIATIQDALSFATNFVPNDAQSVTDRDNVMKILANGGTDDVKATAFKNWLIASGQTA